MAFAATHAHANQPEAAASKFVEVQATADTLRQLHAGGYVLYLRHGSTNNAQSDRLPTVDLADCNSQRPLSDAGRQLMARVGEAMRQAQIPIGEFRVSPMCRTRESAAAAFPTRMPLVDNNLMYISNFTSAEKVFIIANTRDLLSNRVPLGSNRLLLGHAPNLMDLMGYFPKEGTMVIFRPKGTQAGFDYVASVLPTAWVRLRP
jgi:phosphohistidine phosphatase SixA